MAEMADRPAVPTMEQMAALPGLTVATAAAVATHVAQEKVVQGRVALTPAQAEYTAGTAAMAGTPPRIKVVQPAAVAMQLTATAAMEAGAVTPVASSTVETEAAVAVGKTATVVTEETPAMH
jgi:hypothetical protein